jgi:hypothetical protein
MASKLTEIRQALEGLFAQVGVRKKITFNTGRQVAFDDPALDIGNWLRVAPLLGPVDSHLTAGSWKFTRKFRVLFAIGMNDMDVGGLEEIEAQLTGCIARGVRTRLGLDYVQDVRWRGGEYGLFERIDRKNEKARAAGTETWLGMGDLEVDFVVTRTEIESWAPTTEP